MENKKGFSANLKTLIAIVVVLVLVGALITTALVPLFNSTAIAGNSSGRTGVPLWVPSVLGILGVIAFIFVILRVAGK